MSYAKRAKRHLILALLALTLAFLGAACDTDPAAPTPAPTAALPDFRTATPVTLVGDTPTPGPTTSPPTVNATPGLTVNPVLGPGSIGWLRLGLHGVELAVVGVSADNAVFYAWGPDGWRSSSDFGATWTRSATDFAADDLAITADAIYAADPPDCFGPGGLYRSDDGGATWPGGLAAAGAPVSSGPNLVAASCAGTQLSSDGGASWQVVDPNPLGPALFRYAIAAAADTVYAAYFANDSIALRRSGDNGATWATITPPPNFHVAPGSVARALAVLPGDPQTVFLNSASGLLRSTDGGATWAAIGDKLATPPTTMLTVPSGRGAVYAAVPGQGVLRTTNGQTWTTVANDLPAGAINYLAYVPTTRAADTLTPPLLIAATADGLWRVSLASAR